MSDERRPVAILAETFCVRLEVPRTDEERLSLRLVRDDGTVHRFMEWMIANDVLSLPGGASGPGFYIGTFDVKDRAQIVQWFRDNGVEMQHG